MTIYEEAWAMAEVIHIDNYKPRLTETYFFDANVWIYLFANISGSAKAEQKAYSAFLKEIQNRNAAVFVNSLVITEFANAWLRFEYIGWKRRQATPSENDYKKHFLPTDTAKDAIELIKNAIQKILKIAEKSSDEFNSISIETIFNDFGKGDLNDAFYCDLMRRKNWILVTNDRDVFEFADGLKVVSALA